MHSVRSGAICVSMADVLCSTCTHTTRCYAVHVKMSPLCTAVQPLTRLSAPAPRAQAEERLAATTAQLAASRGPGGALFGADARANLGAGLTNITGAAAEGAAAAVNATAGAAEAAAALAGRAGEGAASAAAGARSPRQGALPTLHCRPCLRHAVGLWWPAGVRA